MWCPEGYVLLTEIEHTLRHGAYATIGIPEDFLSTTEGKRIWSLAQNGIFLAPLDEAEAYVEWLLHSFLTVFEADLRVSIASGIPVRLAEGYIATDMLHDVFATILSEELRDEGNVSQYLTNNFSFKTYYSFPTDRIDRMKAADFSFQYINRRSMTFNSEYLNSAAASVLDGMPLCIKRAFVPIDPLELLKFVCAKQTARANDLAANRLSGNARLSDEIVKAIHAGQVRTKRDAKLHFGDGIKTEAFNAIWREVAVIMPEVSKPGPRGKPSNS